jgi:hypothetical protein
MAKGAFVSAAVRGKHVVDAHCERMTQRGAGSGGRVSSRAWETFSWLCSVIGNIVGAQEVQCCVPNVDLGTWMSINHEDGIGPTQPLASESELVFGGEQRHTLESPLPSVFSIRSK